MDLRIEMSSSGDTRENQNNTAQATVCTFLYCSRHTLSFREDGFKMDDDMEFPIFLVCLYKQNFHYDYYTLNLFF